MTDSRSAVSTHAAQATLRAATHAALRGDDAAFEQIHRRLNGGLMRLLVRRTGVNAELAEELAQKTWINVWRALREGRYDPNRAAISTFAYAVAANVWRQHCRASPSSSRVGDDAEFGLSFIEAESDDPLDALHAAELLDALRACLRSTAEATGLTPGERRIVTELAAGKSERELGTLMGVAASTIHARKTAALNKLRACLQRKGFGIDSPERDRPPGE